MKPVPNPTEWLCLESRLPAADRDRCVELLWELETIGLEETDDSGEVLIKAFFPGHTDERRLHERFLAFARLAGLTASPVIYRQVSDPDDWVENYKKNFHAFSVGDTFYIHPTWEPASPDHPVNLVIDPGHAFGTGTHESTQLCLLALETTAQHASTLCDAGTGSGILAMAALKLNHRLRVLAFDVDFQATEMARENFARNNCSQIQLAAASPDAVRGPFDLVVANLALGIFQQVASELARLAGNRLILSGFTVDQEALVADLFGSGGQFKIARRSESGGWACLELAR